MSKLLPPFHTVKKEPRPTADRTCVVCGKPLDFNPRPGLFPLLYADPFCSRVCCEKFHEAA